MVECVSYCCRSLSFWYFEGKSWTCCLWCAWTWQTTSCDVCGQFSFSRRPGMRDASLLNCFRTLLVSGFVLWSEKWTGNEGEYYLREEYVGSLLSVQWNSVSLLSVQWNSVSLLSVQWNSVSLLSVQWNSVITYPQGKWKKVCSKQSTFYPKQRKGKKVRLAMSVIDGENVITECTY